MRNNLIKQYPRTSTSSGNAFISLQYSLVQWKFRIRTPHDIKQGQFVHIREVIDKKREKNLIRRQKQILYINDKIKVNL